MIGKTSADISFLRCRHRQQKNAQRRFTRTKLTIKTTIYENNSKKKNVSPSNIQEFNNNPERNSETLNEYLEHNNLNSIEAKINRVGKCRSRIFSFTEKQKQQRCSWLRRRYYWWPHRLRVNQYIFIHQLCWLYSRQKENSTSIFRKSQGIRKLCQSCQRDPRNMSTRIYAYMYKRRKGRISNELLVLLLYTLLEERI